MSLDALSIAECKMAELKIPLITVSKLTGISATELSAIFNRQREAGVEKELKIDTAIKALAKLAEEIAPLPLDFRQSQTLRDALDKIKAGELTILAAENGAFAAMPHAIKLGERYYCGRDPLGRILSSIMQRDATSMSVQLARQVLTKLAEKDYKADLVVNKYRLTAHTLEEAWGVDWSDPAIPIEDPDGPQGGLNL
jgi:hypothetical protein